MLDLGSGAAIHKEDGLEARADRALRQPHAGVLIKLDHGAQPCELGGPAKVVHALHVVGGVLGRKLHIVKDAQCAHHLYHIGPKAVDAHAQAGLVLVQ
jgi:hypothetical protein